MSGTTRPEPWVEVLGIRHHGPGSARAVAAALERLQPDAVLIEGPADADPLTALAVAPGMEPPVALLAYAPDDPSTAAFWPFAAFSPEWQALTWAGRHGVPVRFCDLPASISLASRRRPPRLPGVPEPEPEPEPDAADELPVEDEAELKEVAHLRTDPIAVLARAAGQDDPERWWEDVVESRLDGDSAFEAITEAMTALREDAPEPRPGERADETRREAYMRQVLRGVLKEGRQRVVVVCGAWHAPALTAPLPPAAADARILKGLPKRKVALTWAPWTHSRLAAGSGYGAGVDSPGWYEHLFASPDHTITRWMTRVAGVLRAQDLPVSSAHVIEAVRLAETLAVMRGRPLAGLDEVTEATRAVLCEGDDVALALVTGALVVGEALGSVPEDTPVVPLMADLRATARRLRVKPDAAGRTVDLDLRKETDLGRSVLFHRLTLLGIGWAVPARSDVRATGTFRETWKLSWNPELELAVVEASMWGATVRAAAASRVVARARGEEREAPPTLADLTGMVGSALLADLPDALTGLLETLQARAARDTDVAHLMDALPALVDALRYGDVRGTDTASAGRVADTLVLRICAGLPAAVGSLDDDGAAALRRRLERVQAAVALRDVEADRERWRDALAGLVDRADVHGLLVGRIVRLLRDDGRITPLDAADRLARALSFGADAPAKAAWVEGFLAGGGLLLVHDRDLLALLDEWVSGLGDVEFTDVLPLVRRTFGEFAAPERRAIGHAARSGLREGAAAGRGTASGWDDVDAERAAPALATVAMLLGVGTR